MELIVPYLTEATSRLGQQSLRVTPVRKQGTLVHCVLLAHLVIQIPYICIFLKMSDASLKEMHLKKLFWKTIHSLSFLREGFNDISQL